MNMKLPTFKALVFSLCVLSFLSIGYTQEGSSNRRGPAVEAVVGVEPQNYNATKKGSEVPFNFGNMTQAKRFQNSQSVNLLNVFVLLSFALLPFAIWFVIDKKAQLNLQNNSTLAQNERPENENSETSGSELNAVAQFSDYKESSSKSSDDSDDISRKAS